MVPLEEREQHEMDRDARGERNERNAGATAKPVSAIPEHARSLYDSHPEYGIAFGRTGGAP